MCNPNEEARHCFFTTDILKSTFGPECSRRIFLAGPVSAVVLWCLKWVLNHPSRLSILCGKPGGDGYCLFFPDPTGTGHGLVYMRLFAACGNDYVEFLAYLESVPLSALTRGRPDQAGRTNFDVRHANCRSTPEI